MKHTSLLWFPLLLSIAGCATSGRVAPDEPVSSGAPESPAAPDDDAASAREGGDAYVPSAAALPATDIFLAKVGMNQRGPTIGEARNVTDRNGYDNQPAFLPDGSGFLFTSGRDPKQTDIFYYDLARDAIEQVTETPVSEYSPTPDPAGGFTTVHESADGQPLWRFDLDGTDRGALLPELQPVGYFAWGNESVVATFVFDPNATEENPGHPPRLVLGDRTTGETEIVFEPVGRSLHRVPRAEAISFVDLTDPEQGRIRMLDVATRELRDVTPTLPGRQDYAWLPDRSLLMADGAVLYRWTMDTRWLPLVDLEPYGARNVTRIAVDPKGRYVAFVSERPAADAEND